MDDGERVRERVRVTRYEPPVYDLDEPMWVAEDDETGCVGIGRVEAEAVGNLLALVDSHGHRDGGHVKLPGRVVERSWQDVGKGDVFEGLLDRLLDRFP